MVSEFAEVQISSLLLAVNAPPASSGQMIKFGLSPATTELAPSASLLAHSLTVVSLGVVWSVECVVCNV